MESSPQKPADVIIVSAYQRGFWLAEQLTDLGLTVILFELTAHLNKNDKQQNKTPFGFFASSAIDQKQLSYVQGQMGWSELSSGLSIMSNNGVFQAHGSLAAHQQKALGLAPETESFLQEMAKPGAQSSEVSDLAGQKTSARLKANLWSKLRKLPYNKTWILNLLTQVAGTRFYENHFALEGSHELCANWRSRYFRAVTDQRKNEAACLRMKSVVSEYKTEMPTNIEVNSDGTIEILKQKAEALVWALSTQETEFLGMQLRRQLFNSETVEPVFTWQRFEFEISDSLAEQALPDEWVLVADAHLPYLGSGLAILQRQRSVAAASQWDVWLRIPTHFRKDQNYLDDHGQEILRLLQSRLPATVVKMVALPLEGQTATEEPARFPVYNPKDIEALRLLRDKNIYYCGPEQCQQLTLDGTWGVQQPILEALIRRKAARNLREEKAREQLEKARLKAERKNRPPEVEK